VILTSSQYMMELILKSFEKRPDEKILVVSQWTACLKLVSEYLTEKGIGHVMYAHLIGS
jgi:SNF2 family DNA or RNA helicase